MAQGGVGRAGRCELRVRRRPLRGARRMHSFFAVHLKDGDHLKDGVHLKDSRHNFASI